MALSARQVPMEATDAVLLLQTIVTQRKHIVGLLLARKPEVREELLDLCQVCLPA